jgi:dolichyl-phosphate beta-glucosyltransferase
VAVSKASQKKQPDLTIVIPAYREEKRIGVTLAEVAAFLKRDGFFKLKKVEVIVVAADSPDGTNMVVESKRKLFESLQLLKPGLTEGKGRNVQIGVLHANGRVILFMDADLATPLHYLETFYKTCVDGCDVVIGTRNLFVYRTGVIRRFASFVGNVLFRITGGVWVEDSQCGFKMFSKPAAQLCFSKLTILDWGFDMEILAIAKVNQLKIKSFRINDWRDVPNGTFTDGILTIAIRSLQDLGHIMLGRITCRYRASGQGQCSASGLAPPS